MSSQETSFQDQLAEDIQKLCTSSSCDSVIYNYLPAMNWLCCGIWVHISRRNLHKIQLLQKYAARIGTSNLNHISWLGSRHRHCYRNELDERLPMVFLFYCCSHVKCHHKLGHTYLCDIIILNSDVICRAKSALQWNSSPNNLKNTNSLSTFKYELQVFILPWCLHFITMLS